MFTVSQRDAIRDELVSLAQTDTEIVGAALVGSSATDLQDALSDIDLAVQMAPNADEQIVVDRWTQHIIDSYGLAHSLDIYRGSVRYRVYLTPASLQIDISFWPYDEFAAIGDRFRLLFGSPNQEPTVPNPNPEKLVGNAWLYALHVRSAIARNEPWHAHVLLDDMRDFILTLSCLRHGVNAHQLRGVDSLPADVLIRFAAARAISRESNELRRSLQLHLDLLLDEVTAVDPDLAISLTPPLREIAEYVS